MMFKNTGVSETKSTKMRAHASAKRRIAGIYGGSDIGYGSLSVRSGEPDAIRFPVNLDVNTERDRHSTGSSFSVHVLCC